MVLGALPALSRLFLAETQHSHVVSKPVGSRGSPACPWSIASVHWGEAVNPGLSDSTWPVHLVPSPPRQELCPRDSPCGPSSASGAAAGMSVLRLRGPSEAGDRGPQPCAAVVDSRLRLFHAEMAPGPTLSWQPPPHTSSGSTVPRVAVASCREGARCGGSWGAWSTAVWA